MRKMYLEKLTLLIIILTKEFRTNSGQCWSNNVLFGTIGSSPVFDYWSFAPFSNGQFHGTVSFLSPKNVTLFVVTYNGGTVFMQPVYNNCSLAIGGNISAGILKIQLNPLKTGQEGDYTFQDETTAGRCNGGTRYVEFTLFIYGVPTQPIIVSNTTDVYEGMSVVLTCSSTSTTVPRTHILRHYIKTTYEWRRDGSIVSTEGRFTVEPTTGRELTIFNINRKDERNSFSCRATEQGGNSSVLSSVYRLRVGYGPDFVTLSPPSTSYTLNENQPLNDIICSATCNPACTYVWTKSGGGTVGTTNGVLSLGTLHRSEAGSYWCKTTNAAGSANSSSVTITVLYGPDSVTLSPPSTSYTLNENQPLNDIICSATCNTACTYVWTKFGGGKVGTTNGLLSLGTLHRSEAGTYWCTPMNAAGSVNSSSLIINVVYGPDSVTLTPSNTSYTMNENEFMNDITCSASCFIACTYTWAKTGGGTVSTTNVLSLRTLQRGEAGSYYCTARNPQSTASANSQSVIVVVRYAPDVNIWMSSTNPTEGQPLELTCGASGVPAIYTFTALTQTHGGEQIPNTHITLEGPAPISTRSIRIPALRMDDTGTYNCSVQNGVPDVTGHLHQTAATQLMVKG